MYNPLWLFIWNKYPIQSVEVVYFRATQRTSQPKPPQNKKIHSEKICFISGNETFLL